MERTFKVGKRYTCTLSYDARGLRAEWVPHIPPQRERKGQLWRDYCKGRDGLFAEVAAEMGGQVMVVSPDLRDVTVVKPRLHS